MKPLAVIEIDQRTERAALLGANHGCPGSKGAHSLENTSLSFPKRSEKMTQKTQGATRTPSRRGFLNRKFTIRPTTSRQGLLALSCRGENRAESYLRKTAGEDGSCEG
jgi:hypothetical protein